MRCTTPSFLLRLSLLATLTATATAQLTVTGVTPNNAARGVSPAAKVTIAFSAPVNPATITPQNVQVSGRWSGPVPGALTVNPGATSITFTPSRALFATEIATLNVTHFVTSATSAPLTGGFMAMWWVDSAPSSGTYVLDHVVNYRLPTETFIRTYGFFAGDVDRDGSPDMTATNEVSSDIRLLKNSGCGVYGPKVVTALPPGSEPSPNEGADFNGDGWLDFVTGNQTSQAVGIFLNDGAGNYLAPATIPVGGNIHGVAVLDCDSDGDVDVVGTNMSDIVLLRNNGNGTFLPPVSFSGGGSGERAIAVADANNDGKADIFCGCYHSQDVTLLLGNGNGTFVASDTESANGATWQMAVGDLNGDGFIDCVVADASNARAGVLRGNGAGGLLPVVGYPVGSSPVSVDIGDLEGDDDLDVIVASFGQGNATMWRNNGAGVLVNATTIAATNAGSCAVIVDFDRDGDTDVILVDELDDKGFVYRQTGPNPPAVQPPTCDAAFRINSFANRGGYGGAAAHFLPGGARAFFDVSGGPSQFFVLFGGAPLQPGVPSPFGIVNLDPGLPLSSFVGGLLNTAGEASIVVPVPVGLPPGSALTMQCILTTPTALIVSNPEQAVF